MERPKINNHEGKASLERKKIEGKYSNYFKVGHNAFEFVIDFGQYYPGTEEAELYTRIITSPISAKNLIEVLQESIVQYEQIHGTINMQDHDS
jgi:hypothetical protein